MAGLGWQILGIILLLAAGTVFSLNAIAARIFSHVKIQEIFRNMNKEGYAEKFFAESQKVVLLCSLIVVFTDILITLLLLRLFSISMELSLSIAAVCTALTAFLLMGFFEVVVAGAWALYAGEEVLGRTYPILHLATLVLSPFESFFKLHDIIVQRLAGVPQGSEEQQEEKQEEFLNVVEQGKMEGIVDEVEQEMIEHVLELSDKTVEEIMTPRTDIIAMKVDSDLPKVLETITAEGHSRIPVYEENIDTVIGLVYAKDLLDQFGKRSEEFKLREKLREAYFVPETKTLRQLLREFQEQKLHIAIVLDEYGGTAGIVTIEDIIEEVVGEITDEYEERPPQSTKRIDESTVEVDARVYIDDFNEEFETELPEEEDYDTLGGFVFSHLGYIPHKDETFEYANLKFTITSSEKRKINRIRIQKLSHQEG
ncbi:MAG: HlyC/CorC family transporter [Sedimentisphaerales bacterium]|nr:HlyC/CorC family transporter [Sedimentisphaerales bacterium]